jgi:hypothetical protein
VGKDDGLRVFERGEKGAVVVSEAWEEKSLLEEV